MKHLTIFRRNPDRGGYSDMNTISNVRSGSCDEGIQDTGAHCLTGDEIAVDSTKPIQTHLQLIMPSQSKPALSFMSGIKKYQSMNGPSSPSKTLGQTTIGSRTNSTGTINTQSLTASSPDSSNPVIQPRSEENVKPLPHIEESPLEKDLALVEYVQTNQRLAKQTTTAATARVIRKTCDDFKSQIVVDEPKGERFEVAETRVSSVQGMNMMNDESQVITSSSITDGHGLLGDCMAEKETVDDELSSCYEDEDLNISLHPIILTVSSDITEKSYEDSLEQRTPYMLELPSYTSKQGLESMFWDVMTSCFVNDSSKLNSQVSDDTSAKLSVLNPLALCGLRR